MEEREQGCSGGKVRGLQQGRWEEDAVEEREGGCSRGAEMRIWSVHGSGGDPTAYMEGCIRGLLKMSSCSSSSSSSSNATTGVEVMKFAALMGGLRAEVRGDTACT
jgi:hypothetical protein